MRRGVLFVLASLCVLPQLAVANKLFFDAFGGQQEGEDDDAAVVTETELTSQDQQEIENAVEQMAAQMKAKLTEHITEQVKQSKAGASKIGMSKVAGPSMALHMAAANNQFEKVLKLLEDGADVDAVTPSQLTPLHAASEGGYKDVVDLLLAHNASVSKTGPDGMTPLHFAASKGRASATDLLISNGAELNAQTTGTGSTPLIVASEMGHSRVVERLLRANATTDIKANDGSTALHAAAREGHEGVVELLLQYGAHADEHDKDDARPLHFASAFKHDEVVRMLLDAGAAPLTGDDNERKIVRKRGMLHVEMTRQVISMSPPQEAAA